MLSAAEVRRHEKVTNFTACSSHLSWVHTRGRMASGSTDSGVDLVLMSRGGWPRVVLSGGSNLSGAIWSPAGDQFVVQSGNTLLVGDPAASHLKPLLKLPTGEKFNGTSNTVWATEGVILYSTSGGSPNRCRLYGAQPLSPSSVTSSGGKGTLLYTAQQGGTLLSYDHSPTNATVAVVHRLANAMLAEVVVVSGLVAGLQQPAIQQLAREQVLAVDGRVEYCKPQVSHTRKSYMCHYMWLSLYVFTGRLSARRPPHCKTELGGDG